MLNINDPRVIDFFNHYHEFSKVRPDLYASADSVNVILPNDLLEYANAAAGHSGFGAGARARGIRKQVANGHRAVKDIFESPETLVDFLESSEKNAEAYVEGIRAKHLASIVPVDPSVKDEFWKRYDKATMAVLLAKFGKELVKQAWDVLTITEFEFRFGLEKGKS